MTLSIAKPAPTRKKWPFYETELAEVVVSNLENDGWDVYQEVSSIYGRADIVAVRGAVVWVIECKLQYGHKVIDQAINWATSAHFVSIAIPNCKNSKALDAAVEKYGIGVMQVGSPHNIYEWRHPKINRKAVVGMLRKDLHEECKHFAKAGSNRGGYWTPFKSTAFECQRVVENHQQGIRPQDAIAKIKHHYASHATAIRCLVELVRKGVVDGVKEEVRKGKIFWTPVEVERVIDAKPTL